ncbi:MAG: serine/threonine-protein phosphatase [Vicinamibacteria bacterium]|nr:serine/threonine-protein phosphatase [Vicinamibacteria bacterium]
MPATVNQGSRQPRPFGERAALHEDYWRAVEALFTHDVTGQNILDFLRREPREAYRFFAREIDPALLAHKPWYLRGPLSIFRVYLAIAHRLSPTRRVLFAVAAPLLLLGWARALVVGDLFVRSFPHAFTWLLLSATFLFLLLVLELKDKLSLKSDLELARQIQCGLLPHGPFERRGLIVRTAMRPANTVGGDYFDLIERSSDRFALVVGDVAGKGMPAALIMGLLQGSLKTLITAGLQGATLIEKLNTYLCSQISPTRMITLLYAEFEEKTNALHYVNAGHNPPFILRSGGTLERLGATGTALGLFADARFEEMVTPLEPGDRALLYTDGIVEALNASEEEYGEERLLAFLQSRAGAEPQDFVDSLVREVLSFCGEARPTDDMTMLYVVRPAQTA